MSDLRNARVMAIPTKQQSLDRLCELLELAPMHVSVGSSVPAEVFYTAARRFGVELEGSMPELGEAIATAAGVDWPNSLDLPPSVRCDSRLTPSKGGSTVTRYGLDRLREAVEVLLGESDVPPAAPSGVGSTYQAAKGGIDAEPTVLERDWEALDEATKAHADLQNAVAVALADAGVTPLSPRSGVDPQFDVAWEHNGRLFVAEVKSTNTKNVVQQTRLGLGQVLEYREASKATTQNEVIAVLITSTAIGAAQLAALDATDVRSVQGTDLAEGLHRAIQ